MRYLIALFLFAVVIFAQPINAQPVNPPSAMLRGNPPGGEGGSCTGSRRIGYLDSSGWMFTCVSSQWTRYGGGGGSGVVTVTTGTGNPSANCTAPSSSNLATYVDTDTQEQWWCSATNTWKKVLSVTGSGPYVVTGATGTVPSTPASGNVTCYFDSTANTQICLDSSGNPYTMVRKWSGTATLGTSAITANACASTVTVTATGALSTDSMTWTPNANISGVTGYGAGSADGLKIYPWISADAVNFAVCNGTGSSITPGAATLNWTIVR